MKTNSQRLGCGLMALVMPMLMGSGTGSPALETLRTPYQMMPQTLAVESAPASIAVDTTPTEAVDVLPAQALVLGVPFISWETASELDYMNKDILNPSWAATAGMILQYWGQDLARLRTPEAVSAWAEWESGNARSLDDLKPWLDQGIPIIVTTGLTPVAHPLYDVARVAGILGVIPEDLVEPRGPTSGLLDPMVEWH